MLSLFDYFQTMFKKHILLKSKTCKLTSEIGKVNSGSSFSTHLSTTLLLNPLMFVLLFSFPPLQFLLFPLTLFLSLFTLVSHPLLLLLQTPHSLKLLCSLLVYQTFCLYSWYF